VAGNIINIKTVAHNTPCDKVLHSIDTIPLENFPTNNVAIINIEEDVRIVCIDLL